MVLKWDAPCAGVQQVQYGAAAVSSERVMEPTRHADGDFVSGSRPCTVV